MEANKTLEQEITDILFRTVSTVTTESVKQIATFIRSQQNGPKWVPVDRNRYYEDRYYLVRFTNSPDSNTWIYKEVNGKKMSNEFYDAYWKISYLDESPTEPVDAEKLWKAITHRIHWHDADIEVVFKGDFIKAINSIQP